MIRKYKIHHIFTVLMLLMLAVFDAQAVTASEALEKGRAKLAEAKSITADFKLVMGASSASGTLYSKGNKFALISKSLCNWYNGKDLYTYNAQAGETTVFRPDASELAEVNPLLYINQASQYTVMGAKTKKQGVETINLVPKQKGSAVKNVSMDLDSKTYLPKYIKIVTASGSTVEITISNIKINASVADSTFDYPKSKYPNVKINDMR